MSKFRKNSNNSFKKYLKHTAPLPDVIISEDTVFLRQASEKIDYRIKYIIVNNTLVACDKLWHRPDDKNYPWQVSKERVEFLTSEDFCERFFMDLL